ncbi:hypothetical protein [Desulfosporosinus sp.]|uniref:hypothetical protein n=1 Tax=Desulfosporosinus sp. TaxID=157907 RepID=UPI002617AB06|nr:hypothetical protein [Desulfosporosinus sp.]
MKPKHYAIAKANLNHIPFNAFSPTKLSRQDTVEILNLLDFKERYLRRGKE